MLMVMPRAASSGARSMRSKGTKEPLPLPRSARTLVMAAVRVVLPLSTCPMVPMFRCGLVRTYAVLDMAVPRCLSVVVRDGPGAAKRRAAGRGPREEPADPPPAGSAGRSGEGQLRAPSAAAGRASTAAFGASAAADAARWKAYRNMRSILADAGVPRRTVF